MHLDIHPTESSHSTLLLSTGRAPASHYNKPTSSYRVERQPNHLGDGGEGFFKIKKEWVSVSDTFVPRGGIKLPRKGIYKVGGVGTFTKVGIFTQKGTF